MRNVSLNLVNPGEVADIVKRQRGVRETIQKLELAIQWPYTRSWLPVDTVKHQGFGRPD